jgi:tetratricopeptide (TPR) repeat protein
VTDEELLALAGKQAFARGRGYFADGRIALSRNDPDRIEGEAEGSETYALWIEGHGDDLRWDCSCPAADDGAFCKHLVAAALTAREEAADRGDDEPATSPRAESAAGSARASHKPKKADELASFLRAQPVDRLSDWLLAFAREDATIEKRLRLYRAADDPAELKAALGKLLDAGGFLDYRRSLAYAQRLDVVLAQLDQAIARDADAGRALCEYTLGRLLRIYERSDDSAGAIGDRLREIAARHARACGLAPPPGKTLARALLALQDKDDWNLFPLAAYWDALGAAGQQEYTNRVLAAFEKLPASGGRNAGYDPQAREVERRVEAVAQARGDYDLLQRVLRRDLSHPRDHLRVLESMREFGRAREALDWAEQAVRRFPDEEGLCGALATCLAEAGLDDEAMNQAWRAFELSPDASNWDLLKRLARDEWPAWRTRALDAIAARERGNASHRVTLLLHDRDTEGAVALARGAGVHPETLLHLAGRIERAMPETAGEFYLRVARFRAGESSLSYSNYPQLIKVLDAARRCTPAATWKPVAVEVRAAHARKSRLMKLMDEAGL